MGLRFRQRIKIFPGVYLNIGKNGISLSFGTKGLSYNIGKKGVRRTIGIPGTGISWSDYTRRHKAIESKVK